MPPPHGRAEGRQARGVAPAATRDRPRPRRVPAGRGRRRGARQPRTLPQGPAAARREGREREVEPPRSSRGRSTRSSTSTTATTSFTSPTASPGSAGCGCSRKESGVSETGVSEEDERTTTTRTRLRRTEENLILEFRDGVFLYVPASRIDLVQKYVGGLAGRAGAVEARRHRVGPEEGQGRRGRPRHGRRDDPAPGGAAGRAGHRVPARHRLAEEFEAAFPYQETPDQLSAIAGGEGATWRSRSRWTGSSAATSATARPRSRSAPRSRRSTTASRWRSSCPTTVLAEQHYRTFTQRFAEYPFVVEVVSRFKSGGEAEGDAEEASRPARSTSSSARTGCFRRT